MPHLPSSSRTGSRLRDLVYSQHLPYSLTECCPRVVLRQETSRLIQIPQIGIWLHLRCPHYPYMDDQHGTGRTRNLYSLRPAGWDALEQHSRMNTGMPAAEMSPWGRIHLHLDQQWMFRHANIGQNKWDFNLCEIGSQPSMPIGSCDPNERG